VFLTDLPGSSAPPSPLPRSPWPPSAPTTLHASALLGIGQHKTSVTFGALNNKYPDDGGD
jgi:hypothetical protein